MTLSPAKVPTFQLGPQKMLSTAEETMIGPLCQVMFGDPPPPGLLSACRPAAFACSSRVRKMTVGASVGAPSTSDAATVVSASPLTARTSSANAGAAARANAATRARTGICPFFMESPPERTGISP